MPESEREELGRCAIQMFDDPEFQARQQELLEDLRVEYPKLFAQAERTVLAKQERRALQDTDDNFVADILALKETDPEGFDQVLARLKERAESPD